MPDRAQVKCINKRDRHAPHERIKAIGGYTNRQWKLDEDDAVGRIKRQECRVDGDVAAPIPHRPGRADFPHPVLHERASLAAA